MLRSDQFLESLHLKQHNNNQKHNYHANQPYCFLSSVRFQLLSVISGTELKLGDRRETGYECVPIAHFESTVLCMIAHICSAPGQVCLWRGVRLRADLLLPMLVALSSHEQVDV